MKSLAMKTVSPSRPTSWTLTMLGCRSWAAARASRKKYSTSDGVQLAAARHLQRHDPVEHRVAGLPHRAEAAHADLLQQLEVAQPPAGPPASMRDGRLVAHQADVAAAGGAGHVVEQLLVDHLDRMTAVGTANLHGEVVPGAPGAPRVDYSLPL